MDLCYGHPELAKHGIRPEVRFTFDSDEMAIENICATDSWAMLPDLVIKKFSSRVTALRHPKEWNAPYDLSWITQEEREEFVFWPKLKIELLKLFS